MSHPSWFGKDMLGDEKMRELWERLGQAAGSSDVLQIRAFNAATRNGIASTEELEPIGYETIRGWHNVGEKTASVIYAATHPGQSNPRALKTIGDEISSCLNGSLEGKVHFADFLISMSNIKSSQVFDILEIDNGSETFRQIWGDKAVEAFDKATPDAWLMLFTLWFIEQPWEAEYDKAGKLVNPWWGSKVLSDYAKKHYKEKLSKARKGRASQQ